MFKVISPQGDAYLLAVETETTHKLNGDITLNFEVVETADNRDFVNRIAKFWTVQNVGGEADLMKFVIKIARRHAVGKKQTLNCIAVAKHISDLKRKRVYDNLSGSFTADRFFNTIFRDTGYNVKIVDKLYASLFENAGDGDTVLNLLQEGLKHYRAEFEYSPHDRTFVITKSVKHKQPYYLKDFVNAMNFQIEEDATEFYTYGKGYGDFKDNADFKKAALKLEYRHPLADVIGVYEAPPVKDGRIKKRDVLYNRVKSLVDDSLKMSISLDFLMLQEDFPEAVPRVGDYIPVGSQVLNLYEHVRIVEVKTKRNAKGKVISQPVILGDYKKHDRYTQSVSNATSYVNRIEKGIGKDADKLNNAIRVSNTMFSFVQQLNMSDTGFSAIDGLNVTAFKAKKGIVYSSDGGKIFIDLFKGVGINTDAIPIATEIQNGLMTKEDKIKLDAMTSGGSVQQGTANGLGSIFYKFVNVGE
ncbi:TPA: phage tail protein [Staphylococcus delphini]|nr:phage tail protein [Staphylococcus delphini]HEC2178787.1 phage tail protein [Staphylococcus delphini]HEC2206483.1 phage tail protein [Staphylococcus delphini]